MGWNTSAVFVADRTPQQALTLLVGDEHADQVGELVTADAATSGLRGDVLYAAQTGGWSQVWDPSMRYAMGIGQAAAGDRIGIAAGTRILTVIFASVSSTYGFEVFDDGALTRAVVYADGEPVVESGEPLPVESTITLPSWGPDEDFVWSVIEAVTGFGHQDEQLFAVHQL
ncbi:hypothetical protein F4553_001654 [Allocatelliglobosispora scoriae]|uniref:Uncharacterized protein n=1 Tax=Allocatelliglobosispora scoriae TaxID=643052 RepID=A0A841BKV7_9ACTN|nr:hypothetical protein [Allocatelliglobosispora scoriae]MBB5868275.1 hypothetical protein [Allocatelliglobosispora scoriae]